MGNTLGKQYLFFIIFVYFTSIELLLFLSEWDQLITKICFFLFRLKAQARISVKSGKQVFSILYQIGIQIEAIFFSSLILLFLCLRHQVTASSLGAYFGCFGEVIEAKVVLDDTKKSKRFGFVSFSRATDARTVLTAGDFFLMGKRIVVGPAVKRVVRKLYFLFVYKYTLLSYNFIIYLFTYYIFTGLTPHTNLHIMFYATLTIQGNRLKSTINAMSGSTQTSHSLF